MAIKVGGGGYFALFFRLLDRCVIRKYESHSTKHFSFISGISRYQKAKGEELSLTHRGKSRWDRITVRAGSAEVTNVRKKYATAKTRYPNFLPCKYFAERRHTDHLSHIVDVSTQEKM